MSYIFFYRGVFDKRFPVILTPPSLTARRKRQEMGTNAIPVPSLSILAISLTSSNRSAYGVHPPALISFDSATCLPVPITTARQLPRSTRLPEYNIVPGPTVPLLRLTMRAGLISPVMRCTSTVISSLLAPPLLLPSSPVRGHGVPLHLHESYHVPDDKASVVVSNPH